MDFFRHYFLSSSAGFCSAAEFGSAVEGHGFSRAASAEIVGALAPELYGRGEYRKLNPRG
jgi:hypothetical protein